MDPEGSSPSKMQVWRAQGLARVAVSPQQARRAQFMAIYM